MGLLTKLTWLTLQENTLTGTLPSQLDQLTGLELFYVNHNNMEGPIPTEVGLLSDGLLTLGLDDNDFTGTVSWNTVCVFEFMVSRF